MLDHLIHQYGKRLYGLCLTLCANKYDAEDLYQDTWIKVLQYLDKYDPVREFEPWLTAICVNTYRDRLRRLKKSPLFHGFRSNEEKDRLLAKAEAPTTPDYAPLYTAIDRLPESLRLTVILYYFRQMDLQDTAKILNIPVGTVKSRLNRARNILKEVLQDETDLRV